MATRDRSEMSTKVLCRFCAQRRSIRNIIDLENLKQYREVAVKLAIFSKEMVDFSDKTLPRTICSPCYSLLNKCYEFFKLTKKSQTILRKSIKQATKKKKNVESVKHEPDFLGVDVCLGEIYLEERPSQPGWSSYPWGCYLCDTSLLSAQQVIQHSKIAHKTCCSFKCDDCNEQPVGFDEFIQHVREHRPELINYCPHCNVKIEDSSHSHTQKSEYSCTFCGQSFETDASLLSHLKKYVPKMRKNTEIIDEFLDTVVDLKNDDLDEKDVHISDEDLYDSLNDTETFENDTGDNENYEYKIKSVDDALSHEVTDKKQTKNTNKQRTHKNEKNINDDQSIYITIKEENDLNDDADSNDGDEKANDSKNNSSKQDETCCKSEKIHDKQELINKNGKQRKRKTQEIDKNKKQKERKTEEIDEYIPNSDIAPDDDDEWTENKKKKMRKIRLPKELTLWSQYPSVCRYCHKLFKTRDLLKGHSMRMHFKCFAMKCLQCQKDKSENVEEFIQHVIKHRPSLKFQCYFCDEVIKDQDHIQTHVSTYHCSICGFNFISNNGKYWHLKSIRRLDLMDPTKIPQERKKLKNIIVNKKRHYFCNICNKYYRCLTLHKKVHEKRTRDHTCELCGKSYFEKMSLDAHKLYYHEAMKIQCKVCGVFRPNLPSLKKHIKTHNLVKKYECDHCKKTFASKDYIRGHMLAHIDRRDFQCNNCSKKFKTKRHLQVHSRVHTGLKPVVCDICGDSFAYWASLKTHKVSAHGVAHSAKSVLTQYGRLDIDPVTKQPMQELTLTEDVIEWSKNMISHRRGRPTASEPAAK